MIEKIREKKHLRKKKIRSIASKIFTSICFLENKIALREEAFVNNYPPWEKTSEKKWNW